VRRSHEQNFGNFKREVNNSQISNAVERVLGDYDLGETFRSFFLHCLEDVVASRLSVMVSLTVITVQRSDHQRQTLTFITHHEQQQRHL